MAGYRTTVTPISTAAFNIPNETFILGIPSTASFSPNVINGDNTFQSIGTSLQSGVYVDTINKQFIYGGAGPTGTVSGAQLSGQNVSAALQDWYNRINLPGTVWYHHFDSDAEMNQFRWTGLLTNGNDPNSTTADAGYMTRSTTGGPDGGPYLQILRKSASAESDVNWWRPFSALHSPGNGLAYDDPAAQGSKPIRTWAPTTNSNTTNAWGQDWYGPSTYPQQTFYFQVRLMSDPNAFSFGDVVGKKLYLSSTTNTLTGQELVTYAGTPFQRMYNGGSPPLESLDVLGRSGQQVGGSQSAYPTGNHCDVTTNPSFCWQFGTNQWDTMLYVVTPGMGTATSGTSVISGIQVYAANAGTTTYTKIWDETFGHSWQTTNQYGWNAVTFNTFHNHLTGTQYWQRYAQLIFSLNWIPCPQF